MTRPPSNIVDIYSPTANMYGCEPCPECGSKYRCVFAATSERIDCDDCGHVEQILAKPEVTDESTF